MKDLTRIYIIKIYDKNNTLIGKGKVFGWRLMQILERGYQIECIKVEVVETSYLEVMYGWVYEATRRGETFFLDDALGFETLEEYLECMEECNHNLLKIIPLVPYEGIK